MNNYQILKLEENTKIAKTIANDLKDIKLFLIGIIILLFLILL